MKTIDQMIDDVLKQEGGYVNHKADKGGATNLGITQGTLSAYLGHQASVDDVKKLTKETARDIYKKNYYFAPKIDRLPAMIQPLMFDMAVNHGSSKAAKLLQSLLISMGYAIIADGDIGQKTCKSSVNACNSFGNEFVNSLVDTRVKFYNDIVHNNPSQSVFLKGWLRRANSFRV
jgi:lysozyme family protein